MRREHLGHQKDLIPPARDRASDELLRRAGAIHFSAIDMGHSQIQATAERRDRNRARRVLDIPGALADHGHLAAGRAEVPFLHERSPLTDRSQVT
jgi:hypothetical protein